MNFQIVLVLVVVGLGWHCITLSEKLRMIKSEINDSGVPSFATVNYRKLLDTYQELAAKDQKKNKKLIDSELMKNPEYVEISGPGYTGSGWSFDRNSMKREVQMKLGLIPDPSPIINQLNDLERKTQKIKEVLL